MENEDEKLIESDDSGNEEEITPDEKQQIRKELSTMSFEDLQKLKEKIGAKVYNETLYGTKKASSKTQFKRTNKNRPREVSSKRPIHLKQSFAITKPQTARDPRFDPLCGNYDEKHFKSNYKFLRRLKKDERNKLEKEYESIEDPELKKKIKLLMQRLDNQIREEEKREKLRDDQQKERMEFKEKLKKGEKPVFKKKSEKRLGDLVQKYEELKKKNKLQKHIEKRTKKMIHKERKQNVFENF